MVVVKMGARVVEVGVSKPMLYYGTINLLSYKFFGEPERASYIPVITLNNWHFDVQPWLSYITEIGFPPPLFTNYL